MMSWHLLLIVPGNSSVREEKQPTHRALTGSHDYPSFEEGEEGPNHIYQSLTMDSPLKIDWK